MCYSNKAEELFSKGLNCAQAVTGAFSELYENISLEKALELSSPFGGGFGRKRELCGAVIGMGIAYGLVKGTHTAEEKLYTYERVSSLADEFLKRYESLICKELLEMVRSSLMSPQDELLSIEEVAKKHWPCVNFVRGAAQILEDYLREQRFIE